MEKIPTTANRVLATLSVAFEWDMKRTTERLYHSDINPCLRIEKYPETKDKKFIDTIEKVLEIRPYWYTTTFFKLNNSWLILV